ncbi:MAG: tetratricopeptide repeat protein [Promethearchaeota archaeon]
MKLDPLSHYFNCNGEFIYYFARHYDQAIEQARKTTDLFGSACPYEDLAIGLVYNQKGMYENAIAVLEKRRALSKDNVRVIAELGYAYALSGQTKEAHKIIEELNELGIRKFVDSYFISIIYIALGDKDEAFRLLEKANEKRSIFFLWVNVDPRFDPIRSDPRFQKLLNRMNFPKNKIQ